MIVKNPLFKGSRDARCATPATVPDVSRRTTQVWERATARLLILLQKNLEVRTSRIYGGRCERQLRPESDAQWGYQHQVRLEVRES